MYVATRIDSSLRPFARCVRHFRNIVQSSTGIAGAGNGVPEDALGPKPFRYGFDRRCRPTDTVFGPRLPGRGSGRRALTGDGCVPATSSARFAVGLPQCLLLLAIFNTSFPMLEFEQELSFFQLKLRK